MDTNDFILQQIVIDNMTWSYSRLSSFDECHYGWHLNYLDCVKGENNFFGQFGSFCHKILEKFFKGELTMFDVVDYYKDHYIEAVTYDAPANSYTDIGLSYYNRGLDYFEHLVPLANNWEILGVEKPVHFTVGKYPFVGYIDLLLRDRTTGAIKVVDHKSGSIKRTKKGAVAKADQEHFLGFKRQLYLYSIPVINEYGVQPGSLKWNLFKDCDEIEIPFDKDEFEATKKWAVETIERIRGEQEWKSKIQLLQEEKYPFTDAKEIKDYFCDSICNYRENGLCKFRQYSEPEIVNPDDLY